MQIVFGENLDVRRIGIQIDVDVRLTEKLEETGQPIGTDDAREDGRRVEGFLSVERQSVVP